MLNSNTYKELLGYRGNKGKEQFICCVLFDYRGMRVVIAANIME